MAMPDTVVEQTLAKASFKHSIMSYSYEGMDARSKIRIGIIEMWRRGGNRVYLALTRAIPNGPGPFKWVHNEGFQNILRDDGRDEMSMKSALWEVMEYPSDLRKADLTWSRGSFVCYGIAYLGPSLSEQTLSTPRTSLSSLTKKTMYLPS
ncbi:hypothetical protein L210DRAFT_3499208 [Boletus edulis BED1]|uniref:Uncharacterized protein n=1 Tax=Boletus edulis BED1 TaxID=1328754 RepID=A0AAD4C814_BOLED|nr:hypothetical protein L210DRAFT_3499208 [Boletus edulis BED1]